METFSPCGLYDVHAMSMTDVGCVRQTNEDAYFCDVTSGIYVVCDGMGGHLGGEVASAVAVEEFSHMLSFVDFSRLNPGQSYKNYVLEFVNDVDKKIEDTGRLNPNLHSMGTTVVGMVLTDLTVEIFHMGDSRAYYVGEALERMTQDHSSVSDCQTGQGDYHMITNAMGYPQKGNATYSSFVLRDGYYVLCSDGLWSMIEEEEFTHCLKGSQLSKVKKNMFEI